MDEWHKETPLKVVFARNMNQDGSQPNTFMPIVPWIRRQGRRFKPLTHSDFDSYTVPLPLEIAKQRDLRKLSSYLSTWHNQDEIDALYPEPEDDAASDESESDSGSSGGE